MGFLIRCALWFSLVLLFLPLNTKGEVPEADTVSPLEAIVAMRDALHDLADICERQPGVCATAAAAAQTIAARAKEGMRIAQDIVEREQAPEPQEPVEPAQMDTTGSIPASE